MGLGAEPLHFLIPSFRCLPLLSRPCVTFPYSSFLLPLNFWGSTVSFLECPASMNDSYLQKLEGTEYTRSP